MARRSKNQISNFSKVSTMRYILLRSSEKNRFQRNKKFNLTKTNTYNEHMWRQQQENSAKDKEGK